MMAQVEEVSSDQWALKSKEVIAGNRAVWSPAARYRWLLGTATSAVRMEMSPCLLSAGGHSCRVCADEGLPDVAVADPRSLGTALRPQ